MHDTARPVDRELAEIEAAAVRSWPALETADVDGWLWRHASGGSFRANSVSTLSFRGADADAAVREAERRYGAKGAACPYLQAETPNTAAIALYEAFGFRVAGRYHLRTKL